jgi:23S rRNA pseudouridine1911/1915/1917 synthase
MTEKAKLYSTKVPKPLDKTRIDMVLVNLFRDLSRGQIRKYIDEGNVFLNKKRIWIAKYEVATGDTVEINLENGDKSRYEFNLKNILFENENFLVLNKPAGMMVEDSKKNFPIFKALKKLDQNYENQEFLAINRLDKETSGLMLVAKSLNVQAELLSLWANKKIQKTYQALVMNVPKKLIGVIDTNIGQNSGHVAYGPKKPSRFEGGKTALTNFKVLTVLKKGAASILAVEPKTGRSHQIRIHLASIGCPILGDKIYGSKYKANPFYQIPNRQMLHASQLIFELYGTAYNFHAPAPSDFNQLSKFIKNSNIEIKSKVPSKIKRGPAVKTKLRVSKRRKPGETAMRDKIFSGKVKKG